MASGTTTNPSLVPSTTKQTQNASTKIEYNQRLVGYLSITMCSGINFISISIVNREYQDPFERVMSVAFGVLTFLIASLVLLQDRSQRLVDYFHYTNAKNGYIEGVTLISMVLWWMTGVGVITKPGGLAYQASNIYYSSWGSLVSCLYTLDLWSTEKDILSISEITSVSCTLKSWWIHFISAFVVFACRYVGRLSNLTVDFVCSTVAMKNFKRASHCKFSNLPLLTTNLWFLLHESINLHILIDDSDAAETLFAIVLGLVSIAVSTFWIGVHLNFFSMWGIQEGGWFELFSTFFMMFVWIVGVGVFTTDGTSIEVKLRVKLLS